MLTFYMEAIANIHARINMGSATLFLFVCVFVCLVVNYCRSLCMRLGINTPTVFQACRTKFLFLMFLMSPD